MTFKTSKILMTALLCVGVSFGTIGCGGPSDMSQQISQAETFEAAKAIAVEEMAGKEPLEIMAQMADQSETVVALMGEMKDEKSMRAVASEMKVMSARAEALSSREGDFNIQELRTNEAFTPLATRMGEAQQKIFTETMRLQGEYPDLMIKLQAELEAAL